MLNIDSFFTDKRKFKKQAFNRKKPGGTFFRAFGETRVALICIVEKLGEFEIKVKKLSSGRALWGIT